MPTEILLSYLSRTRTRLVQLQSHDKITLDSIQSCTDVLCTGVTTYPSHSKKFHSASDIAIDEPVPVPVPVPSTPFRPTWKATSTSPLLLLLLLLLWSGPDFFAGTSR